MDERISDQVEPLISRGYASQHTFAKIDRLWERLDGAPACIVCFQLPFKLHVSDSAYVVRSSRQTVPVSLYFDSTTVTIDTRLRLRSNFRVEVFDVIRGAREAIVSAECTQCMGVVHLWGHRLTYYPTYLELLRRQKLSGIVVPGAENPYQHIAGSITGHAFESDLASRARGEVLMAIRRFLKDYAVTSLHEVEQPKELLSLFASPAEDRFFPFGNGKSVLQGLVRLDRSIPLKVVTPQEIEVAGRWPLREFSVFEKQIFALRRLADDGDPGLALVGLCSLLEWLFKAALPPTQKNPGGLQRLIDHDYYNFIGSELRQVLHIGRITRNGFVHEQPAGTRYTGPGFSHFENASDIDSNASKTLATFQEVALAAFECFRLINIESRRSTGSGAPAP